MDHYWRVGKAKRQAKMAALCSTFILISLFSSGCPSSSYHRAVVAEHDFKLAVQSFQQAEMTEYQSGRIDAVTHKQLEAGIEKVALAGQTLTTSLQQGANNTTVSQNFSSVSSALTDLMNNGVLGIKNDNSKRLLTVTIQTAQAILQNVQSLLALPSTTTLGGN